MKRPLFFSWLFLFLMSGIVASRAATVPPDSSSQTYSLERCLQIAIDHNPDLRVASNMFLQAKGQSITLHALLYPTVSVQGLTTPLTIYVQINQVIYDRAVFPQLRLSHLTEDQAFINYRQTLANVVFQVRQNFTNILAARDQAELIRQFSKDKVEAVKSTQQLFDAGQVEKSVVVNIQVQSNLATQRLANIELSYVQAKILLENQLGQALPQSAHFVGNYNTTLPDNLDTGELIGEAMRDREDLKLLESQKLSEEQQVQIVMQTAYPIIGFESNSTIQPPALGFASQFNAEANYGEPSTVVAAGETQLPLSLYANWTFFDGGLTRGYKMTAQAAVDTQEVAVAQIKQSITGEIAGAVSRIITQRKSLNAMEDQPKSEELRQLSETAYQAGKLRQLDKVNLEDNILSEELLRLSSQYQLSLAAAALDHALGHGLKIVRSAPPQSHP